MEDSSESLGTLFRAAREQSGRQIADIAAELHINAAHLHALENEDFDALPSHSFAKGYIRAYARAVETDPEPLLKAYLRSAPPAPVWQTNNTVIEETEKSAMPVVVVTAVVAATLVALFVVWFLNSGYLDKESTVVDPTQSEPAVESPLIEGSADPEPAGDATENSPETSAAEEPAAADDESPEQAAETEESGKDGQGAGAAEVVAEKDGKARATADSTPKVEKKPEKKPTRRVAPSTGNPDLIKAPEGSDKVEITLKADSWVDITDANGNRLLRGLYLNGARKTLIGKAPFEVFLGNAPAVSLTAGGKPFDTSSFVRPNKTARFAVLKQ
jgi:cytoskeleton protein RodZ